MSLNIGMAARTDVFKWVSAVTAERLMQGKPVDDKLWIVAAALTIIGFVAYQLLVASWLDTSKFAKGSAKVALDDIVKFSTMFAVCRVLTTGAYWQRDGLTSAEYIKDCGFFIASLVTYDLLFSDLVAAKTMHMNKGVQTAVNDVLKLTVLFTMYNFAQGGAFDQAWLMTSGGFMLGCVVYDLAIEKVSPFTKYINNGVY
jgi:hypothetical protein